MRHSRHQISVREVIATVLIMTVIGNVVQAQIPGLPAPGPQAGTPTVPPKKAVVATEGPIKVKESVSDHALQQFLAKFLPKVSGRARGRSCCRRRRGEPGGTRR